MLTRGKILLANTLQLKRYLEPEINQVELIKLAIPTIRSMVAVNTKIGSCTKRNIGPLKKIPKTITAQTVDKDIKSLNGLKPSTKQFTMLT